MSLPSGFLRRYRAFLAAVSRQQGVPEEELDRFFIDYPESLLLFLVASREAGGPSGFADAFRLVDLVEGLGAAILAVQEPEQWDPVVLGIRRGDNVLREVSLTRAALNLSRPRLLSLLRDELEIDRDTDEAIQIRARRVESDVRTLQKFGDRNLPVDPNAPAGPSAHRAAAAASGVHDRETREQKLARKKRVTHAILKRRPAGAGPDEDDGREPDDPLKGIPWGDILRLVSTAASEAGCKQVRISKIGTAGIVKLSGVAPKQARVEAFIAPAVLADQVKLRDVIEQKVATAIRAAENLRLLAAQASAAEEAAAAEAAEKAAAEEAAPDAAPDAGPAGPAAAEAPAATDGAAAPDGEVTFGTPPPPPGLESEAMVVMRVDDACRAMNYGDIVCAPVGGGRYLKVEATAEDGVRLTVALAMDSVEGLGSDGLTDRLSMLFERARADLG